MSDTQAVADREKAEATHERGGPTAIFAMVRDGRISASVAANVIRKSRMSFRRRAGRFLARTLNSLLD